MIDLSTGRGGGLRRQIVLRGRFGRHIVLAEDRLARQGLSQLQRRAHVHGQGCRAENHQEHNAGRAVAHVVLRDCFGNVEYAVPHAFKHTR